MATLNPRALDETCEWARTRIRIVCKDLGIQQKELAKRMGFKPNTLQKRLNDGAFKLPFLHEAAKAIGVGLDELLFGSPAEAAAKWDPLGKDAQRLFQICEPHEAMANFGLGWFRIPNGPVMSKEFRHRVHQNLFGVLGDSYGTSLIIAHDNISNTYAMEWEKCGGHYNGFEVTSLFFESDIVSMINGDGYYVGCTRFVLEFLENLRSQYIPKLNFRLGIIDDSRLPGDVLYEFQSLESLVVVGTTLSLRRDRSTLTFSACEKGLRLASDVALMQKLRSAAGEISTQRTVRRVEQLLRRAERELPKWEHSERPPQIENPRRSDVFLKELQ